MIESQEKDDGLYRYMSAERCLQVLKDKKIRISSPLKFNDPFDGFRDIESIFDGAIFKSFYRYIERKYIKENGDVKELRDEYKFAYDLIINIRKFKDLESVDTINLIFGNQSKDNIPKEYWQAIDKLSNVAKYGEKDITSHSSLMWDNLMYRTRVLCFSTQKYNVPLWYHYADKYSGVMLSFSQNTNLFDAEHLSSEQPKKVKYLEQNELTGLKEDVWHEFLWKKNDDDINKSFIDSILFEKSKYWKYEKEKRITYLVSKEEYNGLLYNDYELNANAIDGVYFGSEIKGDIKNELLALIRCRFPNAKAYQAHMKHYLKFEEIFNG